MNYFLSSVCQILSEAFEKSQTTKQLMIILIYVLTNEQNKKGILQKYDVSEFFIILLSSFIASFSSNDDESVVTALCTIIFISINVMQPCVLSKCKTAQEVCKIKSTIEKVLEEPYCSILLICLINSVTLNISSNLEFKMNFQDRI